MARDVKRLVEYEELVVAGMPDLREIRDNTAQTAGNVIDVETKLDGIEKQLTRIADALEARNVIDGQMAEFAELLQQGAPQVAHEGHPDLAPDGLPRKRR